MSDFHSHTYSRLSEFLNDSQRSRLQGDWNGFKRHKARFLSYLISVLVEAERAGQTEVFLFTRGNQRVCAQTSTLPTVRQALDKLQKAETFGDYSASFMSVVAES